MKILKTDLDKAVDEKIISSEQSDLLWNYFHNLKKDKPVFNGLNVLYYLGGLLILISMFIFMGTIWDSGFFISLIATIMAIGCYKVGGNLYDNKNLKIPGGLLIASSIGFVPVFIYGFLKGVGYWPLDHNYKEYHNIINTCWIYLEIGTILVGIFVLRKYPITIITLPMSISVWYLSMDLIPLFSGNYQNTLKIFIGLIIIIGAYIVDMKFSKTDFSFWIYIVGASVLTLGVYLIDITGDINYFMHFIFSLFLMMTSVFLKRKVFLIFGSIGVFRFVFHLGLIFVSNSIGFAFSLVAVGGLIIFLGIKYQKYQKIIESFIPSTLERFRPQDR